MVISRSVYATVALGGLKLPVAANALSMRHLCRVMALAESGNMARTADELNCSAAAVTKSVNEIEQLLSAKLFLRVAGSYRTTPEGEILSRRSRAALENYERTIEAAVGCDRARPVVISNKRADVLLALFDHRNLNQAALDLQLTPSAVYGAISALQKAYAQELFHRSQQGELIPTQFCHALARALKLVRAEVRFALEEIASLSSGVRGRVEIGVLPRAREYLLPRAINQLVNDYPELNVRVYDATAPVLVDGVRNGDLDFICGALYDRTYDTSLIQEILLTDHIVAIARADHPLIASRQTTLNRAVEEFGWVVGLPKGIARRVFRQALESNGLAEPAQLIETNSFSLMQGLLLQGDWIGLSSVAEFHHLREASQLVTLDLHLSLGDESDANLPISLIRRAGTTLPPAAKIALQYLHASARESETMLEQTRSQMFPRLRTVE